MMTNYCNIFFWLLYFITENKNYVSSERILGVFPIHAKSHYLGFESLALELVKRGHELVVVSNFPQDPPIENFTDIDISKYTKPLVGGVDINELSDIPTGTINELKVMDLITTINGEKLFTIPVIKNLLDSNEKFDLVIVEMFESYILSIFSYKFNAPTIGFTFSSIMPWVNTRFANPDNPSYIPCISSQYHSKMNFLERVSNTLQTFTSKMFQKYQISPKANVYARKYFGHNAPPLEDVAANASLFLFNSHHSFHGSRPLVPNVVEVGGIHIQPQKNMPKDLEKFINESEHGVIYFCTGSMLKASTLPEDKRLDIIEVFSKLPQRILWKWETETMPGKPDNVKLVKWMPQRDVLAHPNVKLFISHGGLLGTTEAVYSGVPIIGMPFYGDQGVNIEAVQAAGAGIRLDFLDLNKETLYKTIKEILDNPKYKENAVQLSERFRDRPQTPLETAVYWTEYVIRHKGAPHLRSAAVDLTWYQYLLLDVIAFLLVSLLTVLAVLYYTMKNIYHVIKSLLTNPQNVKTKSKRKNE